MYARIKRLSARVALTGLLATMGLVTINPMAHADAVYPIAWTGIGIYPRTSPSMDASRASDAIADGTPVTIVCELEGQAVSNGVNTSTVWDRLLDGSFVPNVFLDTGVDGRTPGTPDCQASAPRQQYFRYGAASEAVNMAPTVSLLPADCTYFISRTMWSGGNLQRTQEWTDQASDPNQVESPILAPGLTRAAINAQAFVDYMVRSETGTLQPIAWDDNTAASAGLGDVIAYDWESDGTIDHLAIVTKLNENGYPFVSQHTENQVNRFWSWSESAGNWIQFSEENPSAFLLRIVA